MKRVIKIAGKILGYTILSVVALLVLLLVILRIPAVQTFVANKVTEFVAEKTGGRMRVNQVRINFVDNVLLKGIYVEEPDGDTLLYAGALEVDISIWRLIKQEVSIDDVVLEDAVAKITQNPATGEFNFQYIVDAFSDTTQPADTTPSNWKISASRAYLNNVRFGLDIDGMKLQSEFGEFEVTLDDLDLNNQAIAADEINLSDSYVFLTLLPTADTTTVQIDTTITASNMDFPLPDIGWIFSLEEMNLERVRIKLDQQGAEPVEGFDYNHLDLDIANINLTDLNWKPDYFTLDIAGISLSSADGPVINNLEGYLEATEKMITVDDLILQANGININWDAKLNYNNFQQLLDADPRVGLEIDLKKTQIKLGDLEPFLPFLWTDSILAPQARQAIINLEVHGEGTLGDLELSQITLLTNGVTKVDLFGSIKGLPDYKTASIDISIEEIVTRYDDVLSLLGDIGIPKEVATLGTVSLKGDIGGRMDSLVTKDLVLATDGYSGLKGNIKAVGLPNIDDTRFTVELDYLRTNTTEINPFVGDSLPEMVMTLGNIGFAGTFKGTITDMDLNGLLTTDIGSLKADVEANFNSKYTHATYDAHIQLDTFHLGKMLDSPDFGEVTLTAEADGEGITLESLHANIKATINKAELFQYHYKDIAIGGKIDQKQFNGTINIDDPNLKFKFDGLVNLNEGAPSFAFTADLDTLNLHKINLASTPFGFSLEMDVDLKGISSKDIDGTALIKDIHVSDSLAVYQMDSFFVEAFDSDTGKTIQISSPILNGYIAGRYNLEALPKELSAFINSYISNVTDSLNKPYQVQEPQQFDMLLTVSNPQPLLDVMVPNLRLDTASITGRFDNQKNDLIISAIVPDVYFDSLHIEKLTIRSGGRGKRFGALVIVDTLTYGNDIDIPHTRLYTFISGDTLRYGLNMYNQDTSEYRLKLGGYMQQNDDEYWFAFDRPMILNGETWQNLEGNRLIVAPEALTFDRFGFQNGQRKFQFNTPDTTSGKNPLELSFSNFPLAELSELISYGGIEMAGIINGSAKINDIKGKLDFTSNITINDITVNESQVGNLRINGSRTGYNLDVGIVLSGANDMSLLGKINTETQEINAGFNMSRIDLKVLDPFLKDIISESSGYLSAEASINGSYTKPDIKGHLGFHDLSTRLAFTGTRITLPTGNKISLTDKEINFNAFVLEDANKQKATLSGRITHEYFTNMVLDIKLKAQDFTFLNKPAKVDELFYGKLVLNVNASIVGPISKPTAEIATSTRPGTDLTVQPLTLEEDIKDAPYVIYYNPNSGDTLATAKQYNVSTLPIDLTINLDVTDAAKFKVVIDPATNDQLEVVAEGDLAINIPSNGNIGIIGGLEIVSGTYNLRQSFLKKTFIIEKGSRIDLSGDPLDARLNINAIYEARIATYSLIGEQAATLTAQEQSEARKPKLVQVVLTMRGILSNPDLSFDIRIPDESGVGSMAARRLQQIKQDQNELNKQVFGILLLNSFITEDGLGGGGGGLPGQSAALKSVSGLINQQLNRFASKVKGLSINVDAASYQGYSANQTSNNVTALGLDISQSLFNDRLEIKVGGDVNLESNTGNENQGSGLTQWAGDFVIEYKLTQNGKYRVKVFNTTDYSLLYQNNVNRTGVGLTFQHSFRKRKKKLPEVKPTTEEEQMPTEETDPNTPGNTQPSQSPKKEEQE